MSLKQQIGENISRSLSQDDIEKAKYGFKVLYINGSKTLVLLLFALMLGILKETTILLLSYCIVRTTGFGTHSNKSIKCTIIGLAEFLGCSYMAIKIKPFTMQFVIMMAIACFTVFALWAPVETAKRPISTKRKRSFKVKTLVLSLILFVLSILVGNNVYRNLISIGVFLEAFNMLPPIQKIIN